MTADSKASRDVKEIYSIRVEINDSGWQELPSYYYENAATAVKAMRNIIASKLWMARHYGKKVHHFNVWRDTPTGHCENDGLESQTINVWIGEDLYEWRVFAHKLITL